MTPHTALIELVDRLAAIQGAKVLITEEELDQWPRAAIKAMKTQRLIAKVHPASSVICPGCERDCLMPVHTLPSPAGHPRSFIVCDKRSDTNRVEVNVKRLTQWQCNIDMVCSFVADCLGLLRNDRQKAVDGLQVIGMVSGNKRSQMLCLQTTDQLSLVAGTTKIPLVEFLQYHEGVYSLNSEMIRRMVDASTSADSRYTPSDIKREVRKMETQELYVSWQKAYRDLKKKHPDMSDKWYSIQISKMTIGHRRNAETIRKNMKL